MKVIEKIKNGAGKVKTKIVENKDKIVKGGLVAGGVALVTGIGAIAINKLNGDYDEFETDEDGYEGIELEEIDSREIIEGSTEEGEED